MKRIALALAVLAAPTISHAQALTIGGQQAPMLRAGLTIPMKTKEELTTKGKNLRVGYRVPLEVAEDVRFNGQIVIPAGTPGMGEVTAVRNKGMWGKSGNIDGRVLYIRVGDRQIRMSGSLHDKGKTGTGGVVAAVAFIPIAGFFTTGTSAKIPMGSPLQGFLDEDVPVVMADGTMPVSAPLVAAAPTAPILPAAPAKEKPVQVAMPQ